MAASSATNVPPGLIIDSSPDVLPNPVGAITRRDPAVGPPSEGRDIEDQHDPNADKHLDHFRTSSPVCNSLISFYRLLSQCTCAPVTCQGWYNGYVMTT